MFRSIAILILLSVCCDATAQIAEVEAPTGPLGYGETVVTKFQAGCEVTATRGGCRNIRVMIAVPLECAEQQVTILEEDFSREVGKVTYRILDGDAGGGARQMLVTIPNLPAGATARAVVTFEVRGRPIESPNDDLKLTLVVPAKPDRELRKYLIASPYIEARDGRIRTIAGDVWHEAGESADEAAPNETPEATTKVADWTRIEALYDYVLENIKYVEGSEDKSAVATLRDGHADCHGRSAMFVALCRASGVPARVVWVNNHCFAEFYLEDAEGQGFWFPAESAGTRAFGQMPLTRTILQKGDNFKVPERPRDRLRYASDYMVGVPLPGSGQPKAKFIREQLE